MPAHLISQAVDFNLAARVQGVLQQHKPRLYLLHFHIAVSTLFCLCRNAANFSMTLSLSVLLF